SDLLDEEETMEFRKYSRRDYSDGDTCTLLENGVPVLRRPELARTLHEAVDVGEEIPPELYRAVAEIIAFVMFRKRKAYA
ncbi:MAG TPA: hypothetical protein EYP11_00015, partial [Aquificaceae bacterium]|nr:hypothetical protein [Aquificaceae bacterium]